MPSGVPLLSLSQPNLTTARTLPGRALVIRYGDRTLAVRRGAQSMTWRGPKVKRGGVRRDLYVSQYVDFARKDGSLRTRYTGYGGTKLTRLSQITTSFGCHLNRS
jgi:hypothetical protein